MEKKLELFDLELISARCYHAELDWILYIADFAKKDEKTTIFNDSFIDEERNLFRPQIIVSVSGYSNSTLMNEILEELSLPEPYVKGSFECGKVRIEFTRNYTIDEFNPQESPIDIDELPF